MIIFVLWYFGDFFVWVASLLAEHWHFRKVLNEIFPSDHSEMWNITTFSNGPLSYTVVSPLHRWALWRIRVTVMLMTPLWLMLSHTPVRE